MCVCVCVSFLVHLSTISALCDNVRALDPDQLLLSVCQVVPEHQPTRKEPSSLEMSISLQSSEPVMVRNSDVSSLLKIMPVLHLFLLLYFPVRVKCNLYSTKVKQQLPQGLYSKDTTIIERKPQQSDYNQIV